MTHEFGFSSQLQMALLEASKAFVKEKVLAIAELISRETQLLQVKNIRVSISSASVLSSSLEASSLRERMFSFLRLADLHVAESIFRHLELFLLDLYAQVCGGDTPSQSPQRTKGHTTRVDAVKESEDACCDPLRFEVRFQLKESEPPFPVLYVLLEDNVNFLQAGDHDFQLLFTPSKTQVLELLHGIIGNYMAAMDETPLIVSAVIVAESCIRFADSLHCLVQSR